MARIVLFLIVFISVFSIRYSVHADHYLQILSSDYTLAVAAAAAAAVVDIVFPYCNASVVTFFSPAVVFFLGVV